MLLSIKLVKYDSSVSSSPRRLGGSRVSLGRSAMIWFMQSIAEFNRGAGESVVAETAI
jgi:hypothetical protein